MRSRKKVNRASPNPPVRRSRAGVAAPKWTKKQDQRLRQAVLKYGTQWSLIAKKHRFQRSINSLVKRWHGKLKQDGNNGEQRKNQSDQSEQEQEEVAQKPKRSQRQQITQKKPRKKGRVYNRNARRLYDRKRRDLIKQKKLEQQQKQALRQKQEQMAKEREKNRDRQRQRQRQKDPEKQRERSRDKQRHRQQERSLSKEKARNQAKNEQKKEQKKEQRKEQKKEQRREVRQNMRSNKKQPSAIKEMPINQQPKVQNQKEQQSQFNNEDGSIIEQNSSMDSSKQAYCFTYNWKEAQDQLLKEYIINQKILNWEDLAAKLKIDNPREVRKRWQKHIYPSIIESRKIGGCLKYSEEEDMILNRGVKIGLTVQQLQKFLPKRTLYSLDARRRRNIKIDEEETPELRFWVKKMNAYKFVQKRHEHLEKPLEEDSFMYRSQSE